MIFNQHSELEGKHAFLSASQYHWLNYDPEKLAKTYSSMLAKAKGTELHDYAARSIKLGQKLKACHKTLNLYVNDAIGFRMTPEQILYYSPNCFGTTDAIYYGVEKGGRKVLRIHDLKTGDTPASMNQLMIYAAIFCLEYHVTPAEIRIELRIYQFDDYTVYEPTAQEVIDIMDKIIESDKIIDDVKYKEG